MTRRRNMTFPAASGAAGRRADAGFTLVELLCALLILSLVTGLVATGVSTALNVQAAERFESQSQILADTIEEALSDTFRSMIESPSEDGAFRVYLGGATVEIPASGQALQAGTGETGQLDAGIPEGALFLDGKDGPVKVLNASAYNGCTVAVSNWSCSLAAVSWDAVITSADGNRQSDSYHFYFRPLESEGMWKGTSATPYTPDAEDDGGSGEVDKSALRAAISTARALEQGNKTASAFQTLQNAITAAQRVADDATVTQSQVDEAQATLADAILAFRLSPSVTPDEIDTTALDTLIAEALSITQGKKTTDAYRTLQNAISAAQSTSSNAHSNSVTQDAVDASIIALQQAIDAFNNSEDDTGYDVRNDPEAPAESSGIDDDLKDLRQWTDDVRKAVSWNLDTASDGVMVLLAEPSWNKSIITMLYYDGHYYVPYIIYNHGQSWESSQEVQWYYTSIPYTLEDVTSGEAYESNGNWYKWVQVR